VVRLDDLYAEVDMRFLLIVYSLQTQWYSDDFGERVFTLRHYPMRLGGLRSRPGIPGHRDKV
jgi:precorrin-3B methylase